MTPLISIYYYVCIVHIRTSSTDINVHTYVYIRTYNIHTKPILTKTPLVLGFTTALVMFILTPWKRVADQLTYSLACSGRTSMENRLCSEDWVSPGQGQVGDCAIGTYAEAHSYTSSLALPSFWCCVYINSHTYTTHQIHRAVTANLRRCIYSNASANLVCTTGAR